MQFRPRILALLGAPFASWTLYGCLVVLGIQAEGAAIAAVVWAVFWTACAYLGNSRNAIHASMRGGAILTSLFLPAPVYALSAVADFFNVIPFEAAVPMFATLCLIGPLYFWTLTLRTRRSRRSTGPMLVMDWHHYEGHAPAQSVPPRNSQMRRAM